MAWTTVENVRLHLIGPVSPVRTIRNEWAMISSESNATVSVLPIRVDSVRVKGILQAIPAIRAVTLDGEGWTQFTSEQVIPGSVAVFDGEYLHNMFAEGIDFIIDYENGRIRREAGSQINSGSTVTVFYGNFQVFETGVDYDIEYGSGRIIWLSGSRIPDPYFIAIDYDVSDSGATDELLSQSILEAEAKITARLTPPYTAQSTHALLTVGSTELSCAVAAQALASKPLGMSRDTASDDRTKRWMELATKFEADAWKTLEPFLRKATRHVGYAKKNG
ncbi:MAG: hypothetical protein OEM52_10465 [bacterium]|nr:hypothetical protein [bacterium]